MRNDKNTEPVTAQPVERRRRRRRNRYDQETVDKLCDMLRKGVPRSTAMINVLGCTQTFYRWMERYPEFKEAVERAEQEAVAFYAERIRLATFEDWRAAAWWLERRFPHEFGRHQTAIISSTGAPKQEIIIELFDSPTPVANEEPIKMLPIVEDDSRNGD